MRTYSLAAIATAGLLASAGAPADAVLYQIAVATFVVPINLTNLSPNMPKVGVNCSATAGPVLVVTPVVDGKVNTVLEVKVPLPEPQGARLTYWCDLMIFGLPGRAYENGRFAKDVGNWEKEFLIAGRGPVVRRRLQAVRGERRSG